MASGTIKGLQDNVVKSYRLTIAQEVDTITIPIYPTNTRICSGIIVSRSWSDPSTDLSGSGYFFQLRAEMNAIGVKEIYTDETSNARITNISYDSTTNLITIVFGYPSAKFIELIYS